MRESMGAALGAEGRAVAFAAPSAQSEAATTPDDGAEASSDGAAEGSTTASGGASEIGTASSAGATLSAGSPASSVNAAGAANLIGGATSAVPGAGLIAGIAGGGEMTGVQPPPALVGYQGITLGDIKMSDGLIAPVTLEDSVRSAWSSALNDVALTADGTPAVVLYGAILHYEGANLMDAATGPFTQLIIRAALVDAESNETLASANLVGRANSVAAGSADGLAKGTAKALVQWLADNGVQVTGLAANLQRATGVLTDPKSLLKSPGVPGVPAGLPGLPTSGTPSGGTSSGAQGATGGSSSMGGPGVAAPAKGGTASMLPGAPGGASPTVGAPRPLAPSASGTMMAPAGGALSPPGAKPGATPMGQMSPAQR
ncbi:MAG: hypothetical protein SF069_09415 [Phycisphaerae bacterium]|nr:hypothetical protein [Phycisphaerae bacterium]